MTPNQPASQTPAPPPSEPVSLNLLLADAGLPTLAEDVAITQIAYHTDQVQPGSLFCCLQGTILDGHEFARQAQAQGAAALLCETPLELGLPEVKVASARAVMPRLAAAFYGHPARYLSVVGVTGTNGKTSVVAMLGAIYRAAGQAAVTIGTLSQSALTTPEAPDLQCELAQARDSGSQAVVMEVSSHAIAQHRIDGIGFELCVFTNLSPEHLDYHETLEDYFQTKQSLFTAGHTHRAVVCTDDSFGQELYANLRNGLDASQCATADVKVMAATLDGTLVELDGLQIQLPVPGRLAVVNANIAAAVARKLDLPPEAIKQGLEALPTIPGRFEVVREQPVAVVVDYAHTPQALDLTLQSCRELAQEGSLHVVFGCGGERDPFKRFAMGKLAGELADFSYLTSDNPRGEDPAEIAADIAAGFETGRPGSQARYLVELDRRLAIEKALRTAHAGDLVLIAGKGHETSQQLGSDLLEFDDRLVAGELAEEIFAASSSGEG